MFLFLKVFDGFGFGGCVFCFVGCWWVLVCFDGFGGFMCFCFLMGFGGVGLLWVVWIVLGCFEGLVCGVVFVGFCLQGLVLGLVLGFVSGLVGFGLVTFISMYSKTSTYHKIYQNKHFKMQR